MENKDQDRLLSILTITLALSSMSVLVFNFVMPQISDEFQLTNAQVSWVASSYALIYGIGTVFYGKLADRYSLKELLTFGLIFIALGSLLGFFSQTFSILLTARVIQAAGAAVIPAVATLIPIRYFPKEKRGAAMGTAFVGLSVGGALGPVVSAVVVHFLNWRWLFCIPFLIILTLPFYRRYLSNERGTPQRIDWLGGGLLATTVTFILMGVTEGSRWLIGGIIALFGFVFWIRTVRDPFLQPQLFLNKKYTVNLGIAFLINGIGFSLYFLIPLLLADVHGLKSSIIAFAMVPAALASALLGKRGGRLADSKGNAHLYFIAALLLISCFTMLSTFTASTAFLISLVLILGNVGQTFMMIALANSVSLTLSKEKTGVGMGLFSMLNFIAGGMATGLYGKVVDIGSDLTWNPLSLFNEGAVYSNIFFVLAGLHALIFIFYYLFIAQKRRIRNSSIQKEKTIKEELKC